MGNIAISVENLGKCYRIGQAAKRPENFREAVSTFISSPFQYLRSRLCAPEPDELFWALKDVFFEVKHGEVLGLIGRNGAGKSTLLKILSRITEPTTGRACVYGRVGSLLEVGTGFHPELTGRENIYLNGTILGMRRAEIDRRFDEIVDFSGIEKLLDTPVKRYSSGMYVRLAFAVAAHLEPEILLVDEVLAVGDIGFQKKCLGKMDAIHQEGRTVLLVSHNMGSILQLCPRAIWIDSGEIVQDNDAQTVVAQYSRDNRVPLGRMKYDSQDEHGTMLLQAYIMDENHTLRPDIAYEESFYVVIEYQVSSQIDGLRIGIKLHNRYNQVVLHTATSDYPLYGDSKDLSSHELVGKPGRHCVSVKIPGGWFTPGRYFLELGIWSPEVGHHQHLFAAIAFDIANASVDSIGEEVLRPILKWNVE